MNENQIRELHVKAVEFENLLFKKIDEGGYSQGDIARVLKKSDSLLSYIHNPLHQATFTCRDIVILIHLLDDEILKYLCDLKDKIPVNKPSFKRKAVDSYGEIIITDGKLLKIFTEALSESSEEGENISETEKKRIREKMNELFAVYEGILLRNPGGDK